ncbi:uncharacterized protein FFB20_08814 [Fusarium fujikuroi]|uniref:Uncharacterized protein n=1 Tax=Fusarium fujikuroi TaxID=5127 RepID=A0A2H3S8J4_FUSFU|nr:uncharacterized protein Y057_8031 [Fusarium fujikuroi]QGI69235.1 hypothetical protein CEK27_013206 [Fusarium fujikuroi]QGI86599.1 hypothetical protein CEK25_013328 [Fusarium fujikuroi]QGJ00124.1 hypothetical protein CEK26_013192 [Fusarium fujikuroi]SCN90811.1 uncharacterized protein FFB20_08814 [Fusarium fujikuroi]
MHVTVNDQISVLPTGSLLVDARPYLAEFIDSTVMQFATSLSADPESTQRQGGKESNRQVHVRAAIARATLPGPADENHHGDAREDLLGIPVAAMHGCKYCTVPYGICSAYPIIILSTLRLSERDIPRMADWQNCWKRAMNRELDNYVGGGFSCRMDAAVGNTFSCSESHFLSRNLSQP